MTSRILPSSKKHLFSKLKSKKITTVDAGWRKFEIIYKNGLKSTADPCYGKTDFDAGEISFDDGLDHELARETFTHELFHVALETCGLGGDEEDSEPVTARNNESLTTLVSRSFLLLSNLNSELFGLLFSEEEDE